jgi:type VI protein secretion system component Hcp
MPSNQLFLQLDGISGDCKEVHHQHWIQVDSYTWGHLEVRFFQEQSDSSAPSLLKAPMNGTPIGSAALEITDKEGTLRHIDFSDCYITSCQTGASPEGGRSIAFTLSYGTFQTTHYKRATDSDIPPANGLTKGEAAVFQDRARGLRF